MTIKRLLILQAALLLGFGAVAVLPRHPEVRMASISMTLPASVGEWYGVDQSVSERELEVLAGDTRFARKVYTNAFGDSIFVSIVLSGEDMNNSLHRPERCLPAQGWGLINSHEKRINLPNSDPPFVPTTALYSGRIAEDKEGHKLTIYNLNYYWFVGYGQIAGTHLRRTYLDTRDRLVKGFNERWAYVTVASTVTDNLTPYGRTKEQTDRMLRDFIRELFPKIETITPATASNNS